MDVGPVTLSPFLQVLPEKAIDLAVRAGKTCIADSGTAPVDRHLILNVLSNRVAAIPCAMYDRLLYLRRHAYASPATALSPLDLVEAIRLGFLVKTTDVCKARHFRSIEIEINRHCNYRCVFCPVSTEPKPNDLMPPAVFSTVLQRGREYGIQQLSLNHYSEPTLHPELVAYVEQAVTAGYVVTLFTNASGLNSERIARLSQFDAVSLVVNLPSCDEETYSRTTGQNRLSHVIGQIVAARDHGMSVAVVINAPQGTAQEEMVRMKAMLEPKGITVALWPTDDRAGLMPHCDYFSGQHHVGRLNGCPLCLSDLNVAWTGEVFLCAQDYHQQYIYGNLTEHSIAEIMATSLYRQSQRWIFGCEEPPDSFICRRCAWTRSHIATELSIGCELRDMDVQHYADILIGTRIERCLL